MRLHESGNRIVHCFGRIAMRRVPALRQLDELRVRDGRLDLVELQHRRVFVVVALYRQQRARDRRYLLRDVPVKKRGIQPRVVPAVKAESTSS